MNASDTPATAASLPAGRRVGQMVRQLRHRHGIDLRELSARLAEVGHPIGLGQLSKLELGQRRIDVDDLLALAVVFNTSPNSLLFPGYPGPSGEDVPVTLTPHISQPWAEVWHWAIGSGWLRRPPGPTLPDDQPGEGADAQIAWYEMNRPHDLSGSYDFIPEAFRGHEGALRDVISAVRRTVRAACELGLDRMTIMRAINWWTAMDAESVPESEQTHG